jgi:hypothetical protein
MNRKILSSTRELLLRTDDPQTLWLTDWPWLAAKVAKDDPLWDQNRYADCAKRFISGTTYSENSPACQVVGFGEWSAVCAKKPNNRSQFDLAALRKALIENKCDGWVDIHEDKNEKPSVSWFRVTEDAFRLESKSEPNSQLESKDGGRLIKVIRLYSPTATAPNYDDFFTIFSAIGSLERPLVSGGSNRGRTATTLLTWALSCSVEATGGSAEKTLALRKEVRDRFEKYFEQSGQLRPWSMSLDQVAFCVSFVCERAEGFNLPQQPSANATGKIPENLELLRNVLRHCSIDRAEQWALQNRDRVYNALIYPDNGLDLLLTLSDRLGKAKGDKFWLTMEELRRFPQSYRNTAPKVKQLMQWLNYSASSVTELRKLQSALAVGIAQGDLGIDWKISDAGSTEEAVGVINRWRGSPEGYSSAARPVLDQLGRLGRWGLARNFFHSLWGSEQREVLKELRSSREMKEDSTALWNLEHGF